MTMLFRFVIDCVVKGRRVTLGESWVREGEGLVLANAPIVGPFYMTLWRGHRIVRRTRVPSLAAFVIAIGTTRQEPPA